MLNELRFISSGLSFESAQCSPTAAKSRVESMKGRRLTPSHGLRLPFMSMANWVG